MKNFECEFEKAVLQDFAAERGDAELKNHVASCDVCGAAVRVRQFMRGLNETSAPAPMLPHAAHLWWKAQILDQQATEERATRPILFVQTAACLIVTLALIAGLLWGLPQLQERLASLPQAAWLQRWAGLSFSSTSQLVSLCAVLLCICMIWMFRAMLAED